MDYSPLNITSFGQALHIKGSTLHRWYRDVLSGFKEYGEKQIHENDIKIQFGSKEKTIEVPILKEENFGANMTIDEKHIGEDFYTIMNNRDTGKIAMICKSVVFSEIEEVFHHHENLSDKIKSITRDFSSLYEKVCSKLFPDATQIGDKFHVILNLFESHQAVRIKYRQKELEKRKIAYQDFKINEQQRLEECERTGVSFKSKKFRYTETQLENNETPLEILARSRYLLYKYQDQWTTSQYKRAKTLFKNYPEIEKAYKLCCQFRDWFSKKNIGQHFLQLDKQLHQWYENVEISEIDELLYFKSMVESNEEIICNYFINGETNAKAEAINSKIQKFISSNKGTRDRNFFFFRLSIYYT